VEFRLWDRRFGEGVLVQHVIRIRDLRRRFGDDEAFRAECSCGWHGQDYAGAMGQREARREGLHHIAEPAVAPAYRLTDFEQTVLAALQEAAPVPALSHSVWDALLLMGLVWLDKTKFPRVMRLTPEGRRYAPRNP
jgi:hypothetical protein